MSKKSVKNFWCENYKNNNYFFYKVQKFFKIVVLIVLIVSCVLEVHNYVYKMEEILEKCHFVPMSTMKKVIELMETPRTFDAIKIFCKRNLVKLQQSRTNMKYADSDRRNFKSVYRIACCKAIYSHNWNKLLYLLKKCPPWEHNWKDVNEAALYVRALVILLMYHPTSQAKGLLNEYLHLVWSCRSDEMKKAVLKILLTLPEKIHGVTNTRFDESYADAVKD